MPQSNQQPDGVKIISHNAAGINLPDDPDYPWRAEIVYRPPEFMRVAFIAIHGATERLVIRGMTKKAIDDLVEKHCLGANHPRFIRMDITGPVDLPPPDPALQERNTIDTLEFLIGQCVEGSQRHTALTVALAAYMKSVDPQAECPEDCPGPWRISTDFAKLGNHVPTIVDRNDRVVFAAHTFPGVRELIVAAVNAYAKPTPPPDAEKDTAES